MNAIQLANKQFYSNYIPHAFTELNLKIHIKYNFDSKIVTNQKLIRSIFQFPFADAFSRKFGYAKWFNLLFRGSQHGFKAAQFHTNCDN